VCVLGAFLSKGPVGLFPLAAPLLLALIPDRRSRMLWTAAGQWAAVAAGAVLLWLASSAHESLRTYFTQQVLASLEGRREITGTYTTIVVALLLGVWLTLLAFAAIAALFARGFERPTARDRSIAFAFVALGLAGPVPLMASPKQMGHYVMPAVSFFAIGAAALLARTAGVAQQRLSVGRGPIFIRVLSVAIVAGSLAAIWLPTLEREPRRLAELDRLDAIAPHGAVAAICPSVNGDWSLHAWCQRRFAMSLDAAAPHEWFLKTRNDAPHCTPDSCRPASDPSGELILMRCR
jgi:hypothetical protein